MQQLLIEQFTSAEAHISEFHDAAKNLYLSGRMMVADQKNLNGRNYPRKEIEKAVNYINEKARAGNPIPGELNHPADLQINLQNVSHIITECWMDGSNANGKIKILNTPSGKIIQALVEGGFKPGVSSRGTGNVNHEGIVEEFSVLTVDVVASPSGPGCYPDAIREAQGDKKILTLAEAVVHDSKAQKYLTKEILKFISHLTKK